MPAGRSGLASGSNEAKERRNGRGGQSSLVSPKMTKAKGRCVPFEADAEDGSSSFRQIGERTRRIDEGSLQARPASLKKCLGEGIKNSRSSKEEESWLNGKWENGKHKVGRSLLSMPPQVHGGALAYWVWVWRPDPPGRVGSSFEAPTQKGLLLVQHPPTTPGKPLTLQNLSILTIHQRSCTRFVPRARGYRSTVGAL